jgi:cell division protein FtsI (penicillin-binding protein 3)
MEVQTGKIFAMAVRPAYNPNKFREFPRENFRNRFIADVFEPGSTFKTFTLSAFVDGKKGNISEEIYCEEGAFELNGYIINDTHSYGWLTVEEIIVHSSNICAGKIGLKLGRDMQDRYVRNFGFGSTTGIDLPGESKGLMRPIKQISRVGVATMAFGQGIGVTGLQMLTALNTIASGGKLIAPHVVDRIEDENGNVVNDLRSQVIREVLNPSSVQIINKVLVNVVHGGGTGIRAAPAGYTVAGKTGTAQKVNLETGGYYDDKYIASFMGYAPAEQPKISVIVIVNDPKGEPWGGSVAAPAFKEIVERTLPLLGILPDRKMRGYENPAGTAPTEVAAAIPLAVVSGVPATQETAVCAGCMPNLAGLSLREVLRAANQLGASVEALGTGRVVGQIPRAGSVIQETKKWRVELAIDPNW